jgi:SAM-dependent methyltransferase
MKALLPILRCQRCRGSFAFSEAAPAATARAEFGVLRCSCSAYPVVDGIPIIQHGAVGMFEHTTGTAQVAGVTPAQLVGLIERGATIEALRECLCVPVFPSLLRKLLGWRLSHGALATKLARKLGKQRVDELLRERDRISAIELFDFFYQSDSPLDEVVGHYFNLRFGQPRHLAALSLLQNVPADGKPLLDIACGGGHLDHYLLARRDPLPIVGIDMNFFHLWIARHWVAPAGLYVCADASDGLPFADDSFSATFCSDAYHYIPNRKQLHQEIERCAPGRLGILTRVGNAEVMPNEGQERTVAGYLEDIGAPDGRALTEATLLRCYLSRRNPVLEKPDDPEDLARSKWLSFVWNLPARLRDTSDAARDWPHATGTLRLNPIYRRVRTPEGLQLRFDFPSIWYAYENNGMMAYHPRRLVLEQSQLDALRAERADDSFEKLVSQFVLLGMPARFAPPLDASRS